MSAVVVFALCVLACVVGHAGILLSVARVRSSTPDPSVPRCRRLVEIMWAVIPALVLAFVLTATWLQVRDRAVSRPHAIIKVAQ